MARQFRWLAWFGREKEVSEETAHFACSMEYAHRKDGNYGLTSISKFIDPVIKDSHEDDIDVTWHAVQKHGYQLVGHTDILGANYQTTFLHPTEPKALSLVIAYRRPLTIAVIDPRDDEAAEAPKRPVYKLPPGWHDYLGDIVITEIDFNDRYRDPVRWSKEKIRISMREDR